MQKENETINKECAESTVEVDLDGEKKILQNGEASKLAAKGIKYEMLEDDINRLKELATESGCDIKTLVDNLYSEKKESRKDELLKKCSGDSELVEHILELEKAQLGCGNGFEELQKQFPKIKEISELPKEVTVAANEKNSALLDEYLRYLRKKEIAKEKADLNGKLAENSAIGSQSNSLPAGYDPAKTEFIKGIWGK